MTSKTIVFTGEEIRADYSGGTNAWLRNDGTATVYASTAPGVTAGADGVVSIPAGQAEYTSGYTVDRWYSPGKCSAAPISGGVKLTSTVTASSTTHAFWQDFEFPLPPGKYTLSLKAADVTGVWAARIRTVTAAGDYVDSYYTSALREGVNKVSVDLPDGEYISAVSIGFNKGTEAGDSLKLAWAKLESGSLATPFVPPDPATELAKCQRYYQMRTTNDIDTLDLRPSMRTITDIKAVEGGYAYVAEL